MRSPHPSYWVGGASDAAMRRAVLYGDAWHPIRFRIAWLKDVAYPRLRRIADAAGKPAPALCPRINLSLAESPLEEAKRFAGQGSIDQIRGGSRSWPSAWSI